MIFRKFKKNLINSLNEVVYIYNFTPHKTTKYKPFIIFYNYDENIYKGVYKYSKLSKKL